MTRVSTLALSLLLAAGLVFVGCDSSGSSSESGTLDVRMSNGTNKILSSAKLNPSEVDSAIVTIDQISVVPSENTADEGVEDVGVTALRDSNFTIDLKRLQSVVDTAVAEIEIPTGKYSQIRFITDGPAKVYSSGSTTPEEIRISSAQQTGLKLTFDPPFEVQSAEDRVTITINWDVSSSLQQTNGNVMTPVVDATADVDRVDDETDDETSTN